LANGYGSYENVWQAKRIALLMQMIGGKSRNEKETRNILEPVQWRSSYVYNTNGNKNNNTLTHIWRCTRKKKPHFG